MRVAAITMTAIRVSGIERLHGISGAQAIIYPACLNRFISCSKCGGVSVRS